MQEVIKLLLGVIGLILAFPIGNFLRSKTLDELKQGKPWFTAIVYFTLITGLIGLILKKDWIMFSSFFIAIVTSRSLKKETKKHVKKQKTKRKK